MLLSSNHCAEEERQWCKDNLSLILHCFCLLLSAAAAGGGGVFPPVWRVWETDPHPLIFCVYNSFSFAYKQTFKVHGRHKCIVITEINVKGRDDLNYRFALLENFLDLVALVIFCIAVVFHDVCSQQVSAGVW